MNKTDIKKVANIVTDYTGREAIFMQDHPHNEQMQSKASCCWCSPLITDGFEIAVCQPSPTHKGSKCIALFTFRVVGGL